MRHFFIVAAVLAVTSGAVAADSDKAPAGEHPRTKGVISTKGRATYTALLKSDDGVITARDYVDVQGLAVVEGDIVIGTHAEVQKQTLRNLRELAHGIDASAIGDSREKFEQWLKGLDPIADQSGGLTIRSLSLGVSKLWPNKRIPYDVDPAIEATEQASISKAVSIWNGLGVITFVKSSTPLPDTDILHIMSAGSNAEQVCLTNEPGHGAHNITVLANDCTLYQVVHELGHVLGLRHEHSRTDRGIDLAVDESNIQSQYKSNFGTLPGNYNGTPYDPCSVMHYGNVVPGDWTISGQDETWFTLTAQGRKAFRACSKFLPPATGCRVVGQRCALSPSDKAGVATLYH